MLAIWSLNVDGGPVTYAVVVEPANSSAVMARTAVTDSAAAGSPRVPATPTGRYHALRSLLMARASVTGSASKSCTNRTCFVSARSRVTRCS